MFSKPPKRLFLTVICILSLLVCVFQLLSTFSESFTSKIRTRKDEKLSFLVLGDFGGTGREPFTTKTQLQVAKQMAKGAEVYSVSTIIGLGDNFYPHGIRNVNDSRFQSTFEDVYYARPLKKARWLMVAGNHDYEGNVSAQIEYSNKSPRWHFPYYYYTEVYKIPGSANTSVQIVMVDTKLLCWETKNNRRQSNSPTKDQHRQWVEKILKNSKSEYLLVVGHNPILSAGVHGGSPCLLSYLKPLLERYHITAYFSGHDHNFQHIQENKMNYFVSGNGNFYDAGNLERRRQLGQSLKILYSSSGGYTILTAEHTSLQVIHVNTKGQYIYSTKLSPRTFKDVERT